MSQRFRPKPNDVLELFGEEYVVQAHAASPNLVHAAEGKAARVYKVRSGQGSIYALKVFKAQFRNAELVEMALRLGALKHVEGLQAAERRVLTGSDDAVARFAELQYAMLMPWVTGITFNDLLIVAGKAGHLYDTSSALRFGRRFLSVMSEIEKARIVHGDVAPGNVMLNMKSGRVELLDLEDIYMPGQRAPEQLPVATAGYNHPAPSLGNKWTASADRYATAVLAAEILLLSVPELAIEATDAGVFLGNRTTAQGELRFARCSPILRSIAPEFANRFEHAWNAQSLDACPPIAVLRNALNAARLKPVAHPESPSPSQAQVSWTPNARQNRVESQHLASAIGTRSGAPVPRHAGVEWRQAKEPVADSLNTSGSVPIVNVPSAAPTVWAPSVPAAVAPTPTPAVATPAVAHSIPTRYRWWVPVSIALVWIALVGGALGWYLSTVM